MLVTVTVLVAVKVTVTISPVLAGLGVGLFTVTVGTPTIGGWTVNENCGLAACVTPPPVQLTLIM
jgi:hypothetical protein